MTCTLTKTLEALDEKLRMLKQNISEMNMQVQDCKTDMNEVKRLIKGLKAGQSNTHSTPR